MLGNLMGALMQSASGSQQGGSDALSQAVGGLLGSQSGSAPVGQLLNGIEQAIGGKPGSAQAGTNQAGADANSPIMSLLGPVASAVAGKAGISPQVATTVAGIAMHYLLSSHPAAGGSAPMNLGSTMQQLATTGGLSAATIQNSGMVNDVAKATGLSQQDAAKSLDAAFSHIAKHVDEKAVKRAAAARRDARHDN